MSRSPPVDLEALADFVFEAKVIPYLKGKGEAIQSMSTQQTAAPQLMSQCPDDFLRGGLFNDIDGDITSIAFEEWDYDGHRADDPVIAVHMGITQVDETGKPVKDEKDNVVVHDAYWATGAKPDQCSITADGYGLLVTGSKSGMNQNSNWHFLLNSLKQFGMRRELEDGLIGKLLGTRAHWMRVPAPERAGLDYGGRKEKGRPPEIVVVNAVKWFGWAKPAAAGTTRRARSTAAAAAPAAAPVNGPVTTTSTAAAQAPEATEDVEKLAADTVLLALNEQPGKSFPELKKLKLECFRRMNKIPKPDRDSAIALIENMDWLDETGMGKWVRDGETIRIDA